MRSKAWLFLAGLLAIATAAEGRGLYSLMHGQRANASTYPILIEGWETGISGSYTGYIGTAGATVADASWEQSTNVAYTGLYSARNYPAADAASAWIYKTNGITAGQTFESSVYIDGDAALTTNSTAFVMFAGGSTPFAEAFHCDLNPRLNLFQLRRWNASSATVMSSQTVANASWPRGEWLRVSIAWRTNGVINATCYKANNDVLASVTATNTTYQANSGYGYGTSQASDGKRRKYYFDRLQITGTAQ